MATPGKAVVRPGGKRGVLSSGKAAVFGAQGQCPACCPCEPFVLGSYTTHRTYAPCWDLTPYQGPGKAPPGSFWRLIEMGSCYPSSYPWYGAGCVDADGRLVNLPNQFCTNYSYNGYMQLQIGCLSQDGTQIIWPGTCRTPTARYSC